MADEIDAGIAYLRSLKQPATAPAVHAAPADPTPAGAVPAADKGNRFQGSEKRRSPRFKCDGSAEICAEGSKVGTWATFSDISLHGCYVEAQATYPVGTMLHMKLEANGVRIETKGSVRVSYPYLGMGIAFVDTSDETRSQLRAMLSTITHSTVIMGPGIASTIPAAASLKSLPAISNPGAALEALTEFFESRQMLMREDFLRILRKSQAPPTKQ